jgi:hypothetical protein
VAPYDVRLDLCDKADQYVALDIAGPDGHQQLFTQEQINAIVASIRPASAR